VERQPLVLFNAGDQDIVPFGQQGANYSFNLADAFGGTENHFGKPLSQGAMVINNRIAQVFEWQVTKGFHCRVNGKFTLLRSLQELF